MMSSHEPVDREAAQSIISFLKNNVPSSDVPNVEAELKKDFVFAKKRAKCKQSKKKKAKCLTRNEKRDLGMYKIPRNSVKYSDVIAMNNIWTDYMKQILELNKPLPECSSKSWDPFIQSLYKADFHGSMLKVVRSKCPSYVGKIGICIMDTKNTFKIVSEDNKVTTLPKKECVFEMHLLDYRIMLFGKQLCARPAERSTKKIKNLLHPDI